MEISNIINEVPLNATLSADIERNRPQHYGMIKEGPLKKMAQLSTQRKGTEYKKELREISKLSNSKDLLKTCLKIWSNLEKDTPSNKNQVVDFRTSTNLVKEERISALHQVPEAMWAAQCTGDGNCLFNAVSISMEGNETLTTMLRLATTTWAVIHCDLYVDMYCQSISDINDARALLYTTSSMKAWKNKPESSSAKDIISYCLKEEILKTARIGEWSGLLQVLFVAGMLQRQIQLYCELEHATGYDILVPPCSCCKAMSTPLHLMMVQSGDARKHDLPPNHFVPLLPNKGLSKRFCAMKPFNMCNIGQLVGETLQVDWVQCCTCNSYYHCLCVGLPKHLIKAGFSCCSAENTLQDTPLIYYPHRRAKPETLLNVYSLYTTHYISEEIIDFYAQLMSESGTVGFKYLTHLAWQRIAADREHGKMVASIHKILLNLAQKLLPNV